MKTIDKKYELTDEVKYLADGRKLFRIRALRDFGDVKAGDLGGFIEKEENLSHDGNAWVDNSAVVKDNAFVSGSFVGNNSVIKDNAVICSGAFVTGATVGGDAIIGKGAYICNDDDYFVVPPIAPQDGPVTFYKQMGGGIGVGSGYFNGNVDDFREMVQNTYDGQLRKEYLAIADLMEMHFNR